jgi:hypothetical protein
MSAPDLLGTLHRIVRYVRIVSDAATVSVRQHTDSHRLVLDLNPGRRPVPHQRFAFDLLTFLSFCRWVSGNELTPAWTSAIWGPAPVSRLRLRSVVGRDSPRPRTRSYSRTPMSPGRYRQQTIGFRQFMIGS